MIWDPRQLLKIFEKVESSRCFDVIYKNTKYFALTNMIHHILQKHILKVSGPAVVLLKILSPKAGAHVAAN